MNRALKLLEALLQVKHNPDNKERDIYSGTEKHTDDPSVQHAHEILKAESIEQRNSGNTLDSPKYNKDRAISAYTGGDYEGINQHLRHGKYVNSEIENLNGKLVNPAIIKHIEPLKELTRKKTSNTFSVYRGTKTKLVDTEKGSVFQDKGFTSTSLRPSVGASFNHDGSDQPTEDSQRFHIRIRPGTKGHYVGGHPDAFSHEKEFLLHPGTQFKVGKTFKHPNGHTYINLHIHSQED